MELNREELDALLGAYAIDALDDDERDEVERLVEADPELGAEAHRLQAAATGLLDGYADDEEVPASLLGGLLARALERPPSPAGTWPTPPARRSRPLCCGNASSPSWTGCLTSWPTTTGTPSHPSTARSASCSPT